ncbi:ModD protein [Rhodobacter capsulatus]|uniref:ModD protein n=1 Tax=Rhodobacter capsulatus TaxID=1061 RepID=UPI004026BC99
MFLIDDTALMALIREDVPAGDLTTRSLGLAAEAGELTMRARGAMTVACSEEAVRILQLLGAEAWIATASGRQVEGGEMLLFARGQVEALLAGWKVAQNLIEWASGLASSATAIVAAARAVNPAVTVACTRKSVPGTRALSLRAVTVGGATVHRTGLSDSVLLFAEHRAFGGADALAAQIARLRASCPERKVVVEVADVAEALAAAQAGAEVLQLEKIPARAGGGGRGRAGPRLARPCCGGGGGHHRGQCRGLCGGGGAGSGDLGPLHRAAARCRRLDRPGLTLTR